MSKHNKPDKSNNQHPSTHATITQTNPAAPTPYVAPFPAYTAKELEAQIIGKLRRNFGRDVDESLPIHVFRASALVLRDIMSTRNSVTQDKIVASQARQVHYLSLEFLMGRSLVKNAYNLGVLNELKEAIESLGFSAPDLFEVEPDAGLGNGGLGRLAACYLEAMTTQEVPATGYSICYELGLFKQKIVDGQQVELPDNWLDVADCWLMRRSDETQRVRFGGTVKDVWDDYGKHHIAYEGGTEVLAIPNDMAIAGFDTDHVNVLRLWDAKSPDPIDIGLFSSGQYLKAVEQKAMAESIAKVLYPEDNHNEGKSLRLKQQYFFVSATIQSICQKHKTQYGTLRNFHQKHVIQINDTHPTLVIPELMRILIDQENYQWDDAWHIVSHTVAYTNHTILAEALERWPQELFESLLPRNWQIMCEIAKRYESILNDYFHHDQHKVSQMAIIWGGEVRMANLCVASCFAVNGVSALHSNIIRREVFHDPYTREPDKFKNVTNGVDHRRWLAEINPKLDALIQECTGGPAYLTKPGRLQDMLKYKDDASVLERLGKIKQENKADFSAYIAKETGLVLNTDAIFDVQVKRLHEYKRQLLNALHIIHLYQRMKSDSSFTFTPRCFIFGAKAAPGYHVAKDIIRLIISLSHTINNDPMCKDRLQVVFLENYRVSLAERLMPASELSEQISTAGKEASGTGNMKFMMNGALTIGTLDGANVEMHEQVGDDNIFLFGLKADEVSDLKNRGYRSHEYYMNNHHLKLAVDQLSHGFNDGRSYQNLEQRLLFGHGCPADEYLLLADFESYREAQLLTGKTYQDPKKWNQMVLVNIAKSGLFSADRSICDYARDIWDVPTKGID